MSPLFSPKAVSLRLITFPMEAHLVSFAIVRMSLLFLLAVGTEPSCPVKGARKVALLFSFGCTVSLSFELQMMGEDTILGSLVV